MAAPEGPETRRLTIRMHMWLLAKYVNKRPAGLFVYPRSVLHCCLPHSLKTPDLCFPFGGLQSGFRKLSATQTPQRNAGLEF